MTLQKEESTSMDAYSSWRYETGIEHILYSYSRDDLEPFENVGFGPSEEKIVAETIQKNFVDLANEYPDTQFYLFIRLTALFTGMPWIYRETGISSLRPKSWLQRCFLPVPM